MVKIAEYCIRCGLCIDLHSQLFSFDLDKDKIMLLPDAQKYENLTEVKAMAADCPVGAIHIKSINGEE